MARGACTFRQRDLSAAIKAVAAAGMDVRSVEVDKDGKIVIHAAKPEDRAGSEAAAANEWDAAP